MTERVSEIKFGSHAGFPLIFMYDLRLHAAAARDHLRNNIRVKRPERRHHFFQCFDKRLVSQKTVLDDFGNAGTDLPLG